VFVRRNHGPGRPSASPIDADLGYSCEKYNSEAVEAHPGATDRDLIVVAKPLKDGILSNSASVLAMNANGDLVGTLRVEITASGQPLNFIKMYRGIKQTMYDCSNYCVEVIGRQIEVFYASTNRDIAAAFASIVQKRIEALVLTPGALFNNNRVQLATLAARHVLPTICSSREFAEAGGLMSYGPSITEEFRQTGIYSGRVLKGAPADLPVMRATKFEFIINLQTARALSLDIPPTLLAHADEVIE
jgi:hypothetical protein